MAKVVESAGEDFGEVPKGETPFLLMLFQFQTWELALSLAKIGLTGGASRQLVRCSPTVGADHCNHTHGRRKDSRLEVTRTWTNCDDDIVVEEPEYRCRISLMWDDETLGAIAAPVVARSRLHLPRVELDLVGRSLYPCAVRNIAR